MTGNRRRRLSVLTSIIVGALLVAGPAMAGGKPIRTVIEPDGLFLPAGFGCEFDIGGEPNEKARVAITEFPDGRTQIIGHAQPTLTNLETGASIVHRSSYKWTETYDAETNRLEIQISGRIFVTLFPGDQGPDGVVEHPGALLSIQGHIETTWDLDTDLLTSFSLDGQATDLCSQLSG